MKYEESKEFIHIVAGTVLNKTSEYVDFVNTKIGESNGYITCMECFGEIVNVLEQLSSSLGRYKQIVVNETVHIIETIEHSTLITFIEDINGKLGSFKNKVESILDLKETDWVDNYSKESPFQKLDHWPILVFLVSAIICLGSSAIFHWFSAHSKNMFEFLNRLDYAGISILIAGSCYPPYYYFFYCEPGIYYFKLLLVFMKMYLTFISTFAIIVFVYSFNNNFNKPHKRKLRGTLFLTLGLSTGIPIVHLSLFG